LKYLLDTNVVSQRTKTRPVAEVMAWLRSVSEDEICLSAITIQEVRAGAELMAAGQKRRAVEAWLEDDLLRGFADRILAVDAAVADFCGRVIVEAISRHRHTPALGDALIAATARVHGLKVATLNRKHFEPLGVELVEF
jgi:predicted nucleic acid-binding protein